MFPCSVRHLGYKQPPPSPRPPWVDFHVAFLLLLQAEAQYGMDWREDQCADESIGPRGVMAAPRHHSGSEGRRRSTGAGPENTNEGRDRACGFPRPRFIIPQDQHSSAHTNTRQLVKTDLGPADVYGRHICPGRGAPAPAPCAGRRDGKTENKAAEGFKWVDGHMVGVSRSVPAPPPPPPRALSGSWVGVRANHEWSRLHPTSSILLLLLLLLKWAERD